jgi:thiamine biosynthesis lipoprotein
MITLRDNPQLHTHSVEAMNTTFTLHLDHPDLKKADEAASACFLLLEELEGQLSRYRPDSDISRINALQAGDSLLIAETTYDCLMKAADAGRDTAGLFDVTLGSRTRNDAAKEASTLEGQLEIALDRPQVRCLQAGRHIDLGGIGKGYALDQLALRLQDFQIRSALLCAGASTLLAQGPQAWPVLLQGDRDTLPISLCAQALSASGTGIQGIHVVHPDFAEQPTLVFKRVWLTAPSAAMADAYTTACLIMDMEDLQEFHHARNGQVKIFSEAVDSNSILPFSP